MPFAVAYFPLGILRWWVHGCVDSPPRWGKRYEGTEVQGYKGTTLPPFHPSLPYVYTMCSKNCFKGLCVSVKKKNLQYTLPPYPTTYLHVYTPLGTSTGSKGRTLVPPRRHGEGSSPPTHPPIHDGGVGWSVVQRLDDTREGMEEPSRVTVGSPSSAIAR